jgi:hypothetical protein
VLLGEAVASTLAIYPDKDYQLSSWIELLRPRLDRDDGPQLADWLAGVILDVRDDAGSSQASDAAKRLIAGESRMRPGATWRLSSWLEDHDVLDRDDRMLCLLEGTQERADCPLWWIALAEGVLPIASALPEWSLKRPLAVATSIHGPSWAAARVRELVARVEVEVPPGSARNGVGSSLMPSSTPVSTWLKPACRPRPIPTGGLRAAAAAAPARRRATLTSQRTTRPRRSCRPYVTAPATASTGPGARRSSESRRGSLRCSSTGSSRCGTPWMSTTGSCSSGSHGASDGSLSPAS